MNLEQTTLCELQRCFKLRKRVNGPDHGTMYYHDVNCDSLSEMLTIQSIIATYPHLRTIVSYSAFPQEFPGFTRIYLLAVDYGLTQLGSGDRTGTRIVTGLEQLSERRLDDEIRSWKQQSKKEESRKRYRSGEQDEDDDVDDKKEKKKQKSKKEKAQKLYRDDVDDKEEKEQSRDRFRATEDDREGVSQSQKKQRNRNRFYAEKEVEDNDVSGEIDDGENDDDIDDKKEIEREGNRSNEKESNRSKEKEKDSDVRGRVFYIVLKRD